MAIGGGKTGRWAALLAGACLVLLSLAAASCTSQPPQGAASSPVGSAARAPSRLQGLCFSPYPSGTPAVEPAAGEADRLLGIVAPYTDGIRTFSSTGTASDPARVAKSKGLYVAAGADVETDPARNDVQVNAAIRLASSGGADMAVIGEESIFYNFVSESALISYLDRAHAAGVKATTSETWGELIGHPKVIAACDVLVANMFPYWENIDIKNSISYLQSCYNKTKAAAGGKEVIVETGWPSAGAQHGAAVANPQNAAYFLGAFTYWARAHHVKYFYFEAFDEPWKVAHEGEVGGHWGIWDTSGSPKTGMSASVGTAP